MSRYTPDATRGSTVARPPPLCRSRDPVPPPRIPRLAPVVPAGENGPMAPTTRDVITAGMPKIVEGYDLDAERSRLRQIPDVVVRGHRLNRGNATVEIRGDLEGPGAAAVRARHNEAIFPNTLAPDSPVVELGWPLSGSFVRCSAGV